jgi:uncharacterized membrane protein YedE/YeeE
MPNKAEPPMRRRSIGEVAGVWNCSALFGIGWGIVGLCPGPAIAALAIQPLPALVFIAAMALGAAVHRFAFTSRRSA